MSDPICPKCKANQSSRVKRVGLLQSLIYPKLGLFPWECGGCRSIFLSKSRGKLKRRRRAEGEAHLPPLG